MVSEGDGLWELLTVTLTAVCLCSQHRGLQPISFTFFSNLSWKDWGHTVPQVPWPQGRGQRACCGHRLHKRACVPAAHLPLRPGVFYFSCCKNITFDLSLWLLKKEETTNRLCFHSPQPRLCLTSASALSSPPLQPLPAPLLLSGAPAPSLKRAP